MLVLYVDCYKEGESSWFFVFKAWNIFNGVFKLIQGNGEDYTAKSIRIFTHYHSGDQIKKNGMGGECSTYFGEERCMQCFDGETWGKESTWKT